MKRILPVIAAAIAMTCLTGCNKKPIHYTFIQNMSDGKQVVEKLDAKNDTDALNIYLDRMSKIIIENLSKTDSLAPSIESMYVISHDGDTLNTNEELLNAVANTVNATVPTAVPLKGKPMDANKVIPIKKK